jgi:hypothetical protein
VRVDSEMNTENKNTRAHERVRSTRGCAREIDVHRFRRDWNARQKMQVRNRGEIERHRQREKMRDIERQRET